MKKKDIIVRSLSVILVLILSVVCLDILIPDGPKGCMDGINLDKKYSDLRINEDIELNSWFVFQGQAMPVIIKNLTHTYSYVLFQPECQYHDGFWHEIEWSKDQKVLILWITVNCDGFDLLRYQESELCIREGWHWIVSITTSK